MNGKPEDEVKLYKYTTYILSAVLIVVIVLVGIGYHRLINLPFNFVYKKAFFSNSVNVKKEIQKSLMDIADLEIKELQKEEEDLLSSVEASNQIIVEERSSGTSSKEFEQNMNNQSLAELAKAKTILEQIKGLSNYKDSLEQAIKNNW